jgi:hypothetical protein
MKRIAIFALLGPLLGFIWGFWIFWQIFSWVLGDGSTFDWHQVILIPLAYAVGIVPCLVTGLFDHFLGSTRWRVLWTALFGYAAALLPLVVSIQYIHGPAVLIFGIVGVVPAAVCSWLSGEK